jgi:filamentous hemagglutinin family protein
MNIAPALADVNANALPSLNTATNADVTTTNNNMNIQITGGKNSVGTLNWNTYNIGKDATVNYEFTANQQTALNKVAATGGVSQIFGKITNSGCASCGYEATGKIILINPNGVLFGETSNVNLNSLTVSTLDGTYDATNKQLVLDDKTNQGDYGIVVRKGAEIYGDKSVGLVSNNISLYNGSKISTNVGPNVGDVAYGKVKLVTADGVTFNYYNNSGIKSSENVKASTDKMYLAVNGTIDSGNIDIKNYSTNADSQINVKAATLKATKAVSGEDGNIWLTSTSKIATGGDATFTTVNATGAENNSGGNVILLASGKISNGASTINAVGDVTINSVDNKVIVEDVDITTAKDVTIKAKDIASIQDNSSIKANNITVSGNNTWISSSSLNGDKITLTADNDVITNKLNLNNKKTYITAGNDVDMVAVTGVGDRQNGLVAKGGNNVAISTDGDLSVASLISGKDMTINAKSVISGYDKTTNVLRTEGDSTDRAYIEVGGKFTSNPDYNVSDSAQLTADGNYNQRHHIEYGANKDEKILLVYNLPVVANTNPPAVDDTTTEVASVSVDDDQATMLNKIPRQPESFSNATNITDGRTSFVDVFAAASQIEIEDDEEE